MLSATLRCARPVILAALLAAGPGFAADGGKIYREGGANPVAVACTSCHGADGQGLGAAGFPALAGVSAAYVAKQLADFRSGSRINPVMQPIAQALSEGEIAAVASRVSAMPGPVIKRVTRADEASGMGATLALRGAWERNIPECVACHGPGGAGVGGGFPPLAGQSPEYLAAQLNAWRQGTRKNDPNDLMGHIARGLSEEEVKAVSEYFAGLAEWRVPQ
ncbi:c-type cytochrome [Azoarcus sp. TTM-91]|uniref:c-type cytochrome n=1 Tax=Azoarcus sp. TTM-91 TaxID=2691581 RepID=UPI00145FB1F8|nr:c-type cytochrome [Azoarcus sp. TTM-91]NMG35342.1 c-type cytochrome [Azoarcus sp. TTM-91]